MPGRPWWKKNSSRGFSPSFGGPPAPVGTRENKNPGPAASRRYRGCSCQGPEQFRLYAIFLTHVQGMAASSIRRGQDLGHGGCDGEPAGLVVTRAASRVSRDIYGAGNFCCARSSRPSGLQRGDERGVISPPARAVRAPAQRGWDHRAARPAGPAPLRWRPPPAGRSAPWSGTAAIIAQEFSPAGSCAVLPALPDGRFASKSALHPADRVLTSSQRS